MARIPTKKVAPARPSPKRAVVASPVVPPPPEPPALTGEERPDELLALLTDDALAVAPRLDGWLHTLMRAIARLRDPEGDERLLAIWRAADCSPALRGLAALALVGGPDDDAAEIGSESAIAAVASDLPALADGGALAGLSAMAVLRGDPAQAYDTLAPLLAIKKGKVGALHLTLLAVLAERLTAEADPRWADLAGRLLTEPSVQTFALSILTTLRAPRSEAALLALLEQQIKAPHVKETPVRLLGYLKSKRAAEPLVRALVSPGLAAWMGDICAALKTIDEPAVIPKLHAARAKIEQGHRKKIDEVIAHLERPKRGGAG